MAAGDEQPDVFHSPELSAKFARVWEYLAAAFKDQASPRKSHTHSSTIVTLPFFPMTLTTTIICLPITRAAPHCWV